MKTLYLDCAMGAAGDMLTAALLELLPDPDEFVRKLNGLGIPGITFTAEPSVKCGIAGTRMRVRIHGSEEGEAPPEAHGHRGPDEIREIVSKLAAQYGAERVYLFGSCARGDMTDSSDIDLRMDKGAIKGFQLAGLLLDLEDSLGRPVDLVPTTSLDQRFLDSIRDDEVLLYEAS